MRQRQREGDDDHVSDLTYSVVSTSQAGVMALRAAATVRRHVRDPTARGEILEALGLAPNQEGHHPRAEGSHTAATAPRRDGRGGCA